MVGNLRSFCRGSVKLESKWATVLFGVVNDDAIVSIRWKRWRICWNTRLTAVPTLSAQGILLTDTVQFVDDQGNVLVSSGR